MSVISGSNSSNSGLVFEYDSANNQKSWLGKPTTNTASSFSIYGSGLTGAYVGKTDDGFSKYSISGTWSGGTYPYSMALLSSANFLGNIPYSAQVEIKTSCPQKFASLYGINYVNDPNMVSSGTLTIINTSTGSQIWKREGFIYSSGYAGGSGTSQYGYLVAQPVVNQVFDPTVDFMYVKNMQIEQNAFCTAYTSSSRSSTQAVVDLTGNNTVTASSLTYNSDGSFSFNGTSDYIDCGNDLVLQQSSAITMSAWINPASWSSLGNIMSKNQNSGYRFRLDSSAGALWWYVSGNAVMGGACPLNTWSHCTVTGDSSGLKAYINGILVASNSTAFAPTAPTGGNLLIGCYSPGTESFNGKIMTASLYNRALSASEVKQNFNASRSRFGI